MSARHSHYVHGTDPEEQARLARMNELLNEATVRAVALAGGERVLDVGAGLGQLTRALARAAGPRGRVLGVERSEEQLSQARRAAAEAEADAAPLELRQGDARALPLAPEEWGTFDVAHGRFILEHVPDPELVVAGMVRAVRTGGRIVLLDDDHAALRLHPEPPGFAPVWDAYCRSYDRSGNDPYIGRRLPALLHEAGAAPRRAYGIPFGACAGDPTFPAYAENVAIIVEQAAGPIAATRAVSADDVRRAAEEVRAWARRPDAVLWYAMCFAEGVKP
jgi:ubiquinone/menaquinone biosynthesis C-methylase UbiE